MTNTARTNELLKGKVAVITGGGQGIGLGISQSFLAAGATVIILQRSPLPAELADMPQVNWIKTNLSNSQSFVEIASQLNDQYGKIDALVNNAGVMFERSLDDMTLDEWEQMISVNLTAPVFLTKHLLPLMRANQGGSIVNIGSIEGLAANPEHTAYCASKGGVHAMTKAMAIDLGKDRIRCNAIAPGWIKSALSDDYINAQQDPAAAWEGLYQMHPVGDIGKPTDVGNLAVYLSSDGASFMTGQVIVLDGGRISKIPLPF